MTGMQQSIRKSLVLLAAVTGVVTLPYNSVSAGGFNPIKKLRNAGKRAERSVRKEAGRGARSFHRAHGLNYTVRIKNPTGGFVRYNFRGQRQVPIGRNRIVTHRGTGNPSIAFNNGRGQTVRHSLSRNGTYTFRWVNGTLVLYRG